MRWSKKVSSSLENPKWKVGHLNIGILGTDGKSFRKIAWITTRAGGIYCGIGLTVGVTTKLSYHTNGDLYQGVVSERPGLQTPPRSKLSYPPISDVKGFVPFFTAGVGWHEYIPEFPFERVDEAVYVDVRRRSGVSFNLGLLEPSALDKLNGIGLGKVFKDIHLHIITRTQPWIVIWTY